MLHQRIAVLLGGNAKCLVPRNSLRWLSSGPQSTDSPSAAASPKPSAASNVNENVPGLSSNCLNVPNSAVGPGASYQGEYKVPEYFCYDKNSYFEAEIEMLKYRLPQPSSVS